MFGSPEDGFGWLLDGRRSDRRDPNRMSAPIPIADTTDTIRTANFLEIGRRRPCFSSGVLEGTSMPPLLCSRVLETASSDSALDRDEAPPFCVSAGWETGATKR